MRVTPSGKVKEGAVYAVLTPAEWQTLWRAQCGRCAMCLSPLKNRYDPTSEGRVASLDHAHGTTKRLLKEGVDPEEAVRRAVRGLLCSYPCNAKILPLIRDCPNMARRTANFLDSWPSREVLPFVEAVY